MKKLPAYILVVAMLVMSIASTAHADCAEGLVCDGMQTVSAAGDVHSESSDHQNDEQQSFCDCCATCGGHHHHHAAFAIGKADHVMASSQTLHSSEGATYLSQLHYPHSKPPQA